MSLNIAVLVKSVPDSEYYDSIEIDPIKKTLVRQGIPTVIGEADKAAVEAALRLREKSGGKVTVLSMGPENARTQLLEALAMGADEAVLICDRRVAGSDTLATSYTLSQALKQMEQVDVVFAGNESDDGATAHVPSQLGEWLGIPHVVDVLGFEYEAETFRLTRKLDNGIGIYNVKPPFVAAVKRGIFDVRYPNVMGVMKAKSKPFTTLSLDDLGVVDMQYVGLAGSPSQCGDLRTVEFSRDGVLIEGTSEEIADAVIRQIKQLVEI